MSTDTTQASPIRILVCDDDRSTCHLLTRMLKEVGKCEAAESGSAAWARFESAWRDGRRFDLVCLDIQMPEVDGLEVLSRIRAFELEQGFIHERERTPVLVITAKGESTEYIRAAKLGVEGYILKPFNRSEVWSALQEIRLRES